jgi:hypothetical protein
MSSDGLCTVWLDVSEQILMTSLLIAMKANEVTR